MLKQLAGALLIAAIGAGAMYAFGPDQRAEVPTPPARAETVGVTPTELAEIQRAWWSEIPEQATSDARNQADTVYETKVRTVQHVDTVLDSVPGGVDTVIRYVALPGRWYLDTLQAPQAPGDAGRYAVTWLAGRADGRVVRQDALVRHPSPPGPLQSVALDTAGLHVEYGRWETDDGPGFLVRKIPASVACGAEAVYVQSFEAYLACETGSFAQLGVSKLLEALW